KFELAYNHWVKKLGHKLVRYTDSTLGNDDQKSVKSIVPPTTESGLTPVPLNSIKQLSEIKKMSVDNKVKLLRFDGGAYYTQNEMLELFRNIDSNFTDFGEIN